MLVGLAPELGHVEGMYTCMYLLDMCRHICRRKWHTTSFWAQGICSACLFFLAIVETIKYAGTLLSPYPTFDANEYLSAEEEYLHKRSPPPPPHKYTVTRICHNNYL